MHTLQSCSARSELAAHQTTRAGSRSPRSCQQSSLKLLTALCSLFSQMPHRVSALAALRSDSEQAPLAECTPTRCHPAHARVSSSAVARRMLADPSPQVSYLASQCIAVHAHPLRFPRIPHCSLHRLHPSYYGMRACFACEHASPATPRLGQLGGLTQVDRLDWLDRLAQARRAQD